MKNIKIDSIMFDKFFDKYKEYTIEGQPSLAVVEQYNKGALPDALVSFWDEYGFGTYMDGFLKVVDPTEYQSILNDAYENEYNDIVFAITAFGDFLLWTGDSIAIVKFRHGFCSDISGDSIELLFNENFTDESFCRIELANIDFSSAKERLGILPFDECYGYVPLLGLGGLEEPEFLDKLKIKAHIGVIGEMLGKVE